MEVTEALAENIARIGFEDLPSEAVEASKRSILDTLGVMLAATTLERACRALEQMIRKIDSGGECTLWGFGGRASPLSASFLNGSLTHALDYDDTFDDAPTHPSGSALPAALAAAELRRVGGKELIAALALANDLNIRLSKAPQGSLLLDYPWFPICFFGIFSATAASGKILGLSAEEMISAFGIALERVYGLTPSITSPESELRAVRDAFTNREGLTAALMAAEGIRAAGGAVERMYEIFYGGRWDREAVLSGLGREFLGTKVSFKPWPSCRITHPFIKACFDIAQDVRDPADLEEIILRGGEAGLKLFEPEEERKSPKLGIAAKFSLPYIVGLVFAKGKVELEDFLPQNLQDPEVLEIARKTKYEAIFPGGAFVPVEVEARTRGGKRIRRRVERIPGSPESPLSDEELFTKFRDCARYSKRPLSRDKIEELLQKLRSLELVEDIREITGYFGS